MRELGSAEERTGLLNFSKMGVCVCFYVTDLMVKKDFTSKEPFEQSPEETHVN